MKSITPLLLALALPVLAENVAPSAPAPFTADWASLTQYQCPEWFRDAKFGIWAHWGPQAVPMNGDWYARGMYEPGNKHYRHHVEHFGHPSTNGYKDIIPLWKAERWDPDRLMALYRQAGAKYFVSMGSHHDNFSLWNDTFHKWNAVEMGPKRDVVGEWQQAAKKYGLKFGVSEHLAASYTWFQSSHRADKQGPFAGVPYDGADPKYQDLYHPPADPGDTGWYSTNAAWQAAWAQRIGALVKNYRPDLLYSDGGLPFGAVGRQLVADLYNQGVPPGGARPETVYTCKSLHGNHENNQFVQASCVPDVERGGMTDIQPYVWQTDTSIGDWYCNRNWKPRGADWIIRALADIVSKNGNLLLNVELRPDGSITPEVERSLVTLGEWMARNGAAIYGTRPWQVFGEGPTRLKGGHFNDSFALTPSDIRFTCKGDALYAIAMGWPAGGQLVVRSLARPNAVESVRLLGGPEQLAWTQSEAGLEITLPAAKVSDIAIVFEIRGKALQPVPYVQAIAPGPGGVIALTPATSGRQTETTFGEENIGWWHDRHDRAEWAAAFPQAGRYRVATTCAAGDGPSTLCLEAAGQQLTVTAPKTKAWGDFQPVEFGTLAVATAGVQAVSIRYVDGPGWKPVNMRSVTLTPVP